MARPIPFTFMVAGIASLLTTRDAAGSDAATAPIATDRPSVTSAAMDHFIGVGYSFRLQAVRR